MSNWDDKAKRLLKSEMVKRGFTNADLVGLLNEIGVEETKASIDSKISRGTFSAAFLIQCLNAMGIRNFIPEIETDLVLQEPIVVYQTKNSKTKIK